MRKSSYYSRIFEDSTRHKKAKKIISILNRFVNLSRCNVLDIGTGSGNIIQDISKECKKATSVDIYDDRIVTQGYSFKKVDDEYLPFKDSSFDVVISNHTIEHVHNQKLHIAEMYRVLKKGGLLYLATPNKYSVRETHYKLPFISWFPRRVSSFLLKLIKNEEWNICPLSYSQLIKLTKKKFKVHNFTINVIKYPKKYLKTRSLTSFL